MTAMAACNANGCDVIIWYSPDYGSAAPSFAWSKDDLQTYESFRTALMTGGVTVLNQMKNSQVAAVVNGKNYTWTPLAK